MLAGGGYAEQVAVPVGQLLPAPRGIDLVTAAGVSAGIDLALWLAEQIAGRARAEAIQLIIEYDPQPHLDSGHRSKASAKTIATSTMLLSRDVDKPEMVKSSVRLLWDRALTKVRSGR